MKKLTYILTSLMIAILMGCSDFLDVKPVGAQFMDDLEVVKNTMGTWQRSLYENRTNNVPDVPATWTSLMYSNPVMGDRRFMFNSDVWSFAARNERDEELTVSEKRRIDRGIVGNDWKVYYDLVGFMNLIITEATNAKGEESLRDILIGEASIQRAFYLFKLLQYYTPVDNASIGIPLQTDINADINEADLSRKSQADIYKQIFSDLAVAEACLARTSPRPSFNVMYDDDWIYRIAAQIYCWKASTAAGEESDWKKAAEYAEKALKAPTNGDNITLPYTFEKVNAEVFTVSSTVSTAIYSLTMAYPEVLLYASFYPGVTLFADSEGSYSLTLWKNLYKEGDKRRLKWFGLSATQSIDDLTETSLLASKKILPGGRLFKMNLPYLFAFRLAETWLIRVEALAMSGDIAGAQQALTTWRSLRYDDTAVLTMPATAEEMQQECYQERRREFLLEGDLYWLDMKRFHATDTRQVKGFSSTLMGNDWRYQFAIPESEIENNPDIVPNPGWGGLIY